MLLVYHVGLDVPLERLLDRALYPAYRNAVERLAACNDPLDAIGHDTPEDIRRLIDRACKLVRIIQQHTAA